MMSPNALGALSLKAILNRVDPQSSPDSSPDCSESKCPDKPCLRNDLQHKAVNNTCIIEVVGMSLQLLANGNKSKSVFDGPSIPSIPVSDYLARMVKYIDAWKCGEDARVGRGIRALIVSLVYLDRMSQRKSEFRITSYNVHRVLMIAMLVSTKFFEDIPFQNSYWSRVAGVSLEELNKLEASFCATIDFDLNVSPSDFEKTFEMLLKSSQ